MKENGNVFELDVLDLGRDKDGNACTVSLNTVNDTWFDLIVGNVDGRNDSVRVAATIVSVNVSKRIGTHNNISVRLKMVEQEGETEQAQSLQVAVLRSALMRREIELRATDDGQKWFAVAERYFVVAVKPIYKRVAATWFVDLDIYSWDKFMDLERRSETYAFRSLGKDILKGMVGNISKRDGSYSVCTEGMRVLKKKVNEKTDEVRIPYLYQCDETDYEFIRRMANRYGEFLYFERGGMNLGLTRVMTQGATGDEEVVTAVEDYATVEALSDGEDYLEITKEDVFNKVMSELGGTDDFILCTTPPESEKDKEKRLEPEYKKTIDELNPMLWSRVLARLFQYDTLVSFGLDNLKGEYSIKGAAKAIANAYDKSVKDDEAKYKETYTDKSFEGNNSNGRGVQALGDYVQDDELVWCVSRAEDYMGNNMYRIAFDDRQVELNLGDVVTCSGIERDTRFVVVEVCGRFRRDDGDGLDSFRNEMEVTVIPLYDNQYAVPLPLQGAVEGRTSTGGGGTGGGGTGDGGTSQKDSLMVRVATVATSNDPERLNRVKVQYNDIIQADKNKASEWLKVLTPWATNEGSGLVSKLNPGDRVLVIQNARVDSKKRESFVIGSYYFKEYDTTDKTKLVAASEPPFGLRKYSNIIRSNNGHTIAFNDAKDGKAILTSFIPFLKFWSFIPKVSQALSIPTANKSTQRALGGIDITDYYGIYSISASSDQRSITIDSPFGTVGINAAMGITVSAPNGNVKIVGKNVDIVAGNNLTLTSGANIGKALPSIFGTGIKSRVKSWWKTELQAAQGVFTGLFDMPALRFAMELLFKPISGTLKVHSGRYLLLESGDGAASFDKSWKYKIKNYVKKEDYFSEDDNADEDLINLCNTVKSMIADFRYYMRACSMKYRSICEQRMAICVYILRQSALKADVNVYETVNGWLKGEVDVKTAEVNNALFQPVGGDDDKLKIKSQLIESALYIKDSVNKLRKEFADFKDSNWIPSISFTLETEMQNLRNLGNISTFNSSAKLFQSGENSPKVLLRSAITRKLTEAGYLKYKNYAPLSNDEAWEKLVDSLEPNEMKYGKKSTWGSEVWYSIAGGVVSEDFWNSFCWDPETKGQILISQSEGSTVSIDGDTLSQELKPMLRLKEVLRDAEL